MDVTADRAYVAIPANYTFKQKGKPVSEAGSIIALTMQKGTAAANHGMVLGETLAPARGIALGAGSGKK